MSIAVRLAPLDDAVLESLLRVAVSDAEPDEVMPPVDGPAGWTPSRIAAFRVFYRDRLAGWHGPRATVMFAIVANGEVVGMIRMSRMDELGVVQTGMWLGRSARGKGLASAALRALLGQAAAVGAHAVVAETTTGNVAALGVLHRCGARLTPAKAPGADVAGEVAGVLATIVVGP